MAIEMEGLEFQIETKAEEAGKGIDALRESLNKLKAATKGGIGLGSGAKQLEKLSNTLQKLDATKIEGLGKALQSLGEVKFSGRRIANQLGHLSEGIDRIHWNDVEKLEDLAKALRDLGELGNVRIPKVTGSVPTSSGDSGASGAATSAETASGQLTRKANEANFAVKALKRTLGEAVAVTGITYPIKQLGAALSAIPSQIKRVCSSLGELYSNFKKSGGVVGAFGRVVGGIFKKSAAGMAAGVKAVASSLAHRLNPLSKKAVGRMGQLLNSFKRIALYRMIRFVLSMITKALKDGINNAYEYSKVMGGDFAQSMDLIATNGKYLTNSLGAMAMPLINALAPAIDFVTDKFVALLNVINMFVARLSGSDTYTAANKIASSYQGVGDAASGAAKKVKDFTTGIDELNIFNDDQGGGGGSGSAGSNFGDMFSEVPIDQNVGNFASSLREAFEKADWKLLGDLIGTKINEIIDKIDFAKIGNKIGNAFDGAIKTAYSMLSTIDFHMIGEEIARLINSALVEVDFTFIGRTFIRWFTLQIDFLMGGLGGLNWHLIGQKIGDFFIGALNEINEWLGKYDWKAIGDKIWDEFVNLCEGIDWGGVATSLFRALGTGLAATVNLIDGFLGSVWDDIKSYFTSKIEECGGNVVAGLWKGISDAFVGAYNWIRDNVVNPFIDAFKSTLGIHSPSTVMAELGEYTILGFLNAIAAPFRAIGTWVTEHIVDPLMNALVGVTLTEIRIGVANTASEWWDNVVGWWNDVAGFAGHFLTGVQNTSSDWWTKTKSYWAEKAGFVGHFLSGVKNESFQWWSNTKRYWSDKVGFAGHFLTGVKNDVVSWWSNTKEYWKKGVIDKGSVVQFGAAVMGKASEWWQTVKDRWNNFTKSPLEATVTWVANIANWWSDIKTQWSGVIGDLIAKITPKWPTITIKTGEWNLGWATIKYPKSIGISWGEEKGTIASNESYLSALVAAGAGALGGGSGANGMQNQQQIRVVDTFGEWMDDLSGKSTSALPDAGDGGYSIFKAALEDFYAEKMETTVTQMASDVQRQADKSEQTIVQVGGRAIANAVSNQQMANGYVFAK